jgi:MoxR-like ATPase
VVLADEINRATPKTQSALLEVMEERQITVAGQRYPLEEPYFVLATQNPIEMEGTYPLPEAQVDRFFFKIAVTYPEERALSQMVDLMAGMDAPEIHPVCDAKRWVALQHLTREVLVSEEVKRYAISLVLATHPERAPNRKWSRAIRYGASPRGVLSLILAGKARALLMGRFHVSRQDIREVALPALRHRVLLSFEGEMEGTRTDHLILEILKESAE